MITTCQTHRRLPSATLLTILMSALLVDVKAFDSFIGIKDGWFVEAKSGKPWFARGIAYQTWNRPLGVWQTPEQINYDLDEMRKMGVNCIRVDFVWQHIEEDGDDIFAWDNYDYLVEACTKREIRLIPLIGYQWPPHWFKDEWYTKHPPGEDAEGILHDERWQSDIMSFSHPEGRKQYQDFISAVCGRYRDAKAIVGWVVGNEYGYLGLWSGKLDGYDDESESAFRQWCEARFGSVKAMNKVWGTDYTHFFPPPPGGADDDEVNELRFLEEYVRDGDGAAQWADMVQWREDAAAEFVALGARAARSADPNHLLSYSTVGMQWGEEDWRYHAEDRRKITERCEAVGAPLDFFSINNYPWAILGHESQNGHWGFSYTKKVSGLPVVVTETGFTSSETMWPDMNQSQQADLVRNALFESIIAGGIGIHVFHWQDRTYISDREKGFGILDATRQPKLAFWSTRDVFTLLDGIDIDNLIHGSEDAEPDVAFLWTSANDSQYNRFEGEMQQVAGALERHGFEPNFVDLDDLKQMAAGGSIREYRVLLLPRNMRVEEIVPGTEKGVLEFIRTEILPAGIHVIAGADLPGMQGPNGQPLESFQSEMELLFGVDVSDTGGFEVPAKWGEFVGSHWKKIDVDWEASAPGVLGQTSYSYSPKVWKYSDRVEVTTGTLWATMDTPDQNNAPAVVAKDHGSAKAVLFTYAPGDISPDGDDADGLFLPDVLPWKWRYDIFGAILKEAMEVKPKVEVIGDGAFLCLPEYRTLSDGSTLWQIKNYEFDHSRKDTGGGLPRTFTISSPLFLGHTVKALVGTRELQVNNGTITLTLPPNGTELLHVVPGEDKTPFVRIADFPSSVRPVGNESVCVKVRYDTRGRDDLSLNVVFREEGDNGDGEENEIYATGVVVEDDEPNSHPAVQGIGEKTFWVFVPDANLTDSDYITNGGCRHFVFEAYLDDRDGNRVSSAKPATTQLEWGLLPLKSIQSLTTGSTVEIPFRWGDLPEYLSWQTTPIRRQEAFPSRVALFRSTKTARDERFSDHLNRVNEVADWLESMGYEPGNPLALRFDNLTVTDAQSVEIFSDKFEAEELSNRWSWDAGGARWQQSDGTLVATRIGNDDNILSVGSPDWTDYTASVKIIYDTQGPYFNDAELYFRYIDRHNFYKVAIHNFYGSWRIKFTSRVGGTNESLWIHTFPKEESPKEGATSELSVQVSGTKFAFYFNGKPIGKVTDTNIAQGSVGIGCKAAQLGISEPPRGYYFIDDDELSYWDKSGETKDKGSPLDLSRGYLTDFFGTLILPSTYLMSTTEIDNINAWIHQGIRSLIVTDGSVGRYNEIGSLTPGRIEGVLGVLDGAIDVDEALAVEVAPAEHYVTQDFPDGVRLNVEESKVAVFATPRERVSLATLETRQDSHPAFVLNTLIDEDDPGAPSKIVLFNFSVDTNQQLTGRFQLPAQRAFEWSRNQAYKLRLEVKQAVAPIIHDIDPNPIVIQKDYWVVGAAGTDTISFDIPETFNTGNDFYYSLYAYPWDTNVPWDNHKAFYTSLNDGSSPFFSIGGANGEALRVFTDQGLLISNSDICIWPPPQGNSPMDAHFFDSDAPEGTEVLRFYFAGGGFGGFGIFAVNRGHNPEEGGLIPRPIDMSNYSDGFLTFSLKSQTELLLELEGPVGRKKREPKKLPSTDGQWKKHMIPIKDLKGDERGVNLETTFGLFLLTVVQEEPTTFFVDDIWWIGIQNDGEEGPQLDEDVDGLPDEWELTNFGSLTRNGQEDFDGDGQIDLHEFVSGSDPTNSGDFLDLGIDGSSVSQVSLKFRRAPGRSYTLESSRSLTQSEWMPLAHFGPVNILEDTVFEVPLHSGCDDRHFFRLRASITSN